jgi:hypothetical protein
MDSFDGFMRVAILWKEDEDLVGVLSPLVSCRILGGAEMILKKEWVPKKKRLFVKESMMQRIQGTYTYMCAACCCCCRV